MMARYIKIYSCLWKLERVEHALSTTWQTIKPNCSIDRLFATMDGSGKQQFVAILRWCQTLRNKMNHFFTNLQYYLMFKVFAYSWVEFLDEMEEARDLDELIVSHERYLTANVEKSLMGNDLIIYLKHCFHCLISFLCFRSNKDRLYESSYEMQERYIVALLPVKLLLL